MVLSPGTRKRWPRRKAQRSLTQAPLLAGERQDEARLAAEAAAEDAGEAAAVLRVVEVGLEGIDADGEVGLVLDEAPRILEGGLQVAAEAEARGDAVGDAAGVAEGGAGASNVRGDVARDVAPQRRAVGAAAEIERPARQALAGVVLAGAVEDDGAGEEALAQLAW